MAEYEFNAEQNKGIDQLHQKLLHVAILFMMLGGVQLVGSFFLVGAAARWVSLVAAVLFLAMGWLFVRPLDNFKRVTTTEGQDIKEMMIALSDLRAAFLLAEIVVAILVISIIVEIMRLQNPI
jgi:hypothetical protein